MKEIVTKEQALEALREGTTVRLISKELREQYPEIYMEAVKHNGHALQYMSEKERKAHPEICIEAVKYHVCASRYVPDEYYIEILKINGMALKGASLEQRKNIEMALIAVQQNEKALSFVAPEIQDEVIKRLKKDRSNSVEWQKECLEEIKDKNNVILCSPTGSGKTTVFLEWAKQKGNKPIFITSPIKVLSNQRYRELVAQGFVVGLETGDIKNVPKNCDFICCTQEIYTDKYTEQEEATLIVDEFHYIFEDNDRARAYIDALHDSKAKNILICSATLGDVEKLKNYIDRVSRKRIL